MKIFVSSTFDDLEPYRRSVLSVIDTLRANGHNIQWLGMESLSAADRPSLDECLAKVGEADLYLGFLGMRYGSKPSGSAISYTEAEFRRATKRRMPRLLFLIDERNANIKPIHCEHDPDSLRQLNELKEEFKRIRQISFFRSPEHLAEQVLTALDRYLPRKSSARSKSTRRSRFTTAKKKQMLQQARERAQIEELTKNIRRELKSPKRDLRAIVADFRRLDKLSPVGELADERDRLEKIYRKQLTERGAKLQKQIQDALANLKKSVDNSVLPKEDWSGQTNTAINELRALGLAAADLPAWKETLRRLEREGEDLAKYLEIAREIQEFWDRAKSTEEQGGFGESIVRDYKEAFTKIQGHCKGSMIVSPAPKRRLEILAVQAERLLNESADKHTLTLTRAAGNEVVTQFKMFLKSNESNPEERVTYFLTPDKNAGYGLLPFKSAVEVAREHVRQFWSDKVTEYVDLARHVLLDNHDPYGAQAQLDKWQDLEGLNDPELVAVGLTLSGEPQIKIKRLQVEIDDKRKIRQDAEGFYQNAVMEGDLEKAYSLVRLAIETDPYTLSIVYTRRTIQDRILVQAEKLNGRAENWLQEKDWANAQEAITQAARLIALDPELHADLLADRIAETQRSIRTYQRHNQAI